jgi:hypothetical protein
MEGAMNQEIIGANLATVQVHFDAEKQIYTTF